jgi:hypothetical protein
MKLIMIQHVSYKCTDGDLAQSSTLDQRICVNAGGASSDADQASCCYSCTLFNPSSATYVKHFISIVPNAY